MPQPAVFLDRDGVLIEDVGYPTRPKQIRLLPGAARGLVRLAAAGFRLVVVTNQSAIARGIMTEKDLNRFHQALDEQLARFDAHIDAYYTCPHHPDPTVATRPDLAVECECRKPKPGMILHAARDLDLDLGSSWIIGDTWRDIQAGQAAGLKTVKLPASPIHESVRRPEVDLPTADARSLEEAAEVILASLEAADEAVAASGPAQVDLAEPAPLQMPADDSPAVAPAPAPPAEAAAPPAEPFAPPSSAPPETPAPEAAQAPFGPEPGVEPAAPVPPPPAPSLSAPAEAPVVEPALAPAAGAAPEPPAEPGPAAPPIPPPPLAPEPRRRAWTCARCGRAILEADLAAGKARFRDGAPLCPDCAPVQPGELADVPDATPALLRAILVELRRSGRRQDAGGLTLMRLLAYILQVAAPICALLAIAVDEKMLFLLAAVFLQLLVLAFLLWERKP